jgi:hypothetical protein
VHGEARSEQVDQVLALPRMVAAVLARPNRLVRVELALRRNLSLVSPSAE